MIGDARCCVQLRIAAAARLAVVGQLFCSRPAGIVDAAQHGRHPPQLIQVCLPGKQGAQACTQAVRPRSAAGTGSVPPLEPPAPLPQRPCALTTPPVVGPTFYRRTSNPPAPCKMTRTEKCPAQHTHSALVHALRCAAAQRLHPHAPAASPPGAPPGVPTVVGSCRCKVYGEGQRPLGGGPLAARGRGAGGVVTDRASRLARSRQPRRPRRARTRARPAAAPARGTSALRPRACTLPRAPRRRPRRLRQNRPRRPPAPQWVGRLTCTARCVGLPCSPLTPDGLDHARQPLWQGLSPQPLAGRRLCAACCGACALQAASGVRRWGFSVHPSGGGRTRVVQAREAEVGHLQGAVARQQQVGGLQVAVEVPCPAHDDARLGSSRL